MKLKIIFILIFPAFLFSCMTMPKNVVYFQDLDKNRQVIEKENYLANYEPVIKKLDELLITVTAPELDQIRVAQFNLPMTSYLAPGEESMVQQSLSVQSFTVDHEGYINYPVIGRIYLAGLTKSQAIDSIRNLVIKYVDEPVITLKILTFQVTVLGEVLKPGIIKAGQEKITILDAIGAANDLTIYGDRNNVLLIREMDNGKTECIRLDLTKSDLISSPYYYLQQNDKIIVTPNKTRQFDSKYGAADGYRLSIFSMMFGAVSVIASTVIAIISLKKN